VGFFDMWGWIVYQVLNCSGSCEDAPLLAELFYFCGYFFIPCGIVFYISFFFLFIQAENKENGIKNLT
jgi:hypothetical protein